MAGQEAGRGMKRSECNDINYADIWRVKSNKEEEEGLG